MEVSDPKLYILAHLMSPLEPIDPVLESPLAHPLLKQRAVAAELLNEVSMIFFYFSIKLTVSLVRPGQWHELQPHSMHSKDNFQKYYLDDQTKAEINISPR